MRIGELTPFLCKAWPKRRRVLTVSAPGVGKTFAHIEATKRLGWQYIGICAPLQSPVKIGGYPRPPSTEGGDATHALFDGIARAFRATEPTVLHFDDLGMANGETLKSVVDLFQFGRIDNRTLPECVTVAASSNDVGHGADVQGLIEPLKSRFHTIIQIETHLDDVIPYGLAKDWPAWYLAWLRNTPDALHDWKPSKSMFVDGACPRGHEYACEWLKDGIDDPEVIAGCIGKGRALQALKFKELQNDLPDIDEVLISPESAEVPENPSARFLISMAIAAKMNGGTWGQALRYMKRLPKPFRAFSIRDAFQAEKRRKADNGGEWPKGYKPIVASRDFTAWAASDDGREIVGLAD